MVKNECWPLSTGVSTHSALQHAAYRPILIDQNDHADPRPPPPGSFNVVTDQCVNAMKVTPVC